MSLNFKLPKLNVPRLRGARFSGGGVGVNPGRDTRKPWKQALIVLALANVAVFFILVRPIGGTAADLAERLEQTRRQVRSQQTEVIRLKALLAKIEKARASQDQFVKAYFMDRRTTSSTILTELQSSASSSGLKPREHAFVIDPVEGSDTLSMMTITANYEGSYGDLIKFVNLLDRSKRFLIIDNIQAAPMQQAGVLAARFKLNTFIRESAPLPQLLTQAQPAPPAPEEGTR